MVALTNFSNTNFASYRVGVPRVGASMGLGDPLHASFTPPLTGPWNLRLCTDNEKYMDRFKSADVQTPNVAVAVDQPRDG